MIVDWQEIEWHIAIVTTGKRREILGKRAIQLQLLAIGSGSAHLLHSAGNCAVGSLYTQYCVVGGSGEGDRTDIKDDV